MTSAEHSSDAHQSSPGLHMVQIMLRLKTPVCTTILIKIMKLAYGETKVRNLEHKASKHFKFVYTANNCKISLSSAATSAATAQVAPTAKVIAYSHSVGITSTWYPSPWLWIILGKFTFIIPHLFWSDESFFFFLLIKINIYTARNVTIVSNYSQCKHFPMKKYSYCI